MRAAEAPPAFAAYGSVSAPQKPAPHHRGRAPLGAVLICLAAPCALFAAVSAALSFELRRDSPLLAWLAVLCCLLAALACAYLASATAARRWSGDTAREPYWYCILAASMLIAFSASFYLGEVNFWSNVLPYLELQTLSSQSAVDPASFAGQQLMDVGRVEFLPGTHLDLNRTIGFKNADRFCVAPIVRGDAPPTTGSYDFWAIGLNCCSGAARDFRCGEHDNPHARAGLRIMREDQRAFYRLAVQQAEAAYGIRARHPVFLYWVQDADLEMESYKADALRTFLLGSIAYCAFQLFVMVIAVVVFAKL